MLHERTDNVANILNASDPFQSGTDRPRRPYAQFGPRRNDRDWRPEEDAEILASSARGVGWIHAYRLPHRSVHAISSRRRVLERLSGERLPRLYRYPEDQA